MSDTSLGMSLRDQCLAKDWVSPDTCYKMGNFSDSVAAQAGSASEVLWGNLQTNGAVPSLGTLVVDNTPVQVKQWGPNLAEGIYNFAGNTTATINGWVTRTAGPSVDHGLRVFGNAVSAHSGSLVQGVGTTGGLVLSLWSLGRLKAAAGWRPMALLSTAFWGITTLAFSAFTAQEVVSIASNALYGKGADVAAGQSLLADFGSESTPPTATVFKDEL